MEVICPLRTSLSNVSYVLQLKLPYSLIFASKERRREVTKKKAKTSVYTYLCRIKRKMSKWKWRVLSLSVMCCQNYKQSGNGTPGFGHGEKTRTSHQPAWINSWDRECSNREEIIRDRTEQPFLQSLL